MVRMTIRACRDRNDRFCRQGKCQHGNAYFFGEKERQDQMDEVGLV